MSDFQWQLATQKADLLFKQGETLAFLVGSGVSLDSPSSLPTGLQFMEELLAQLVPKSEFKQVMGLALHDFDEAKQGERFLRFEQLMLHVQRFDPDLRVLDCFDACSEPNVNHRTLALFIQYGHRVMTTNFDSLLEYALQQHKIPHQLIRPVINRKQWTEQIPADSFPVYKLHGSLRNVSTGACTRDSVQATLKQIAFGKNCATQLELWKKNTVESIVCEHALVVVGYSGLDDFDIIPTLQTIESNQRIIWINHEQNRSMNEAIVEVVGNVVGESAKADIRNAQPQRIDKFLFSLVNQTRSQSNVIRIKVNTKDFLSWLTDVFFERSDFSINTPKHNRANSSLALSLNLTDAERWYAAGDIFSWFDPGESVRYFQNALECARQKNNRILESECQIYLGRQYEAVVQLTSISDIQRLNYWKLACSCCERALTILEKCSGDKLLKIRSTALCNLGALYRLRETNEYDIKAMDLFQKALVIDKKLACAESLARSLNNIAALQYKNAEFDAAINNIEAACKFDREIGDLNSLVPHLGNLGLFCCERGDKKGLTFLEEALMIARQTGCRGSTANLCNTIGLHYARKGDLTNALEYYKEGIKIAGEQQMSLVDTIKQNIGILKRKNPTKSSLFGGLL